MTGGPQSTSSSPREQLIPLAPSASHSSHWATVSNSPLVEQWLLRERVYRDNCRLRLLREIWHSLWLYLSWFSWTLLNDTYMIIDYMIVWRTAWLGNVLVDWLAMTNSLSDRLGAWLYIWLGVSWPACHWLTAWVTDWHTDWLNAWQTDRLADWVTAWLAECLTDWLTDWPAGLLTKWLTAWSTGWLTNRLPDWLTDWLTNIFWHFVDWQNVINMSKRGTQNRWIDQMTVPIFLLSTSRL